MQAQKFSSAEKSFQNKFQVLERYLTMINLKTYLIVQLSLKNQFLNKPWK